METFSSATRATIENGPPISCECLADEHAEETCKHRVGISILPSIIESASEMQALTDVALRRNRT